MIFKNRSLLFCCVALLFVGCTQTTSVEGTATFNGQPIASGAISFRAADGRGPSFGAEIVDGKYQVEKVTGGEKIAILSAIDESKVVKSRADAERIMSEARAAGRDPSKAIPDSVDMFNAEAEGNSRTVEIVDGAQTLDFEITTN